MLINYLKTAYRNLIRNKTYSVINILGLAVSFAVCILLFIYVKYETSFDNFHEKKDRIFRVINYLEITKDKVLNGAFTSAYTASKLTEQIPEIEKSIRFVNESSCNFFYNDKKSTSVYYVHADSCLFDIFTFPLIAGNPKEALKFPYNIVINEDVATKNFGNATEALGKQIKIENKTYTISGVMKNIPANSFFNPYQAFISFSTLTQEQIECRGLDFQTFFLLKKKSNTENTLAKAKNILQKELNEYKKQLNAIKAKSTYQTIEDIHLHSNFSTYKSSNPLIYIYCLVTLGIFLLIIAVINFINLITARSENRAKEIGVRKAVGASRKQLIFQFLTEAILTTFIAFFIGLTLAEISLEPFNNLLNTELSNIFLTNTSYFIYIILTVIIIGVLAGLYPAIFLSSFKTTRILKGSSTVGKQKSWLKIGLVVVQFAIAIFLISDLIILYSQIQFVKNKELGFSKNQVLIINNLTNKIDSKKETILNELKNNTSIQSISASSTYPSNSYNIRFLSKNQNTDEKIILYKNNIYDADYIKVMGIEIIAGSNFSNEKTEDNSILINETTVKTLNLINPVGEKIFVNSVEKTIIGVLKDFHFESLYTEINPLVIYKRKNSRINGISIRFKTGETKQLLSYLKEKFTKFDPDYDFNYEFMDKFFDRKYQKDENNNLLITYGSVLAILISILGMLALTSFTVLQRSKEIGIRKTLGASTNQILFLLSKDLLKWVLTVNIISIPASYIVMNWWLENFAYRIELSWWYFFIAPTIALTIAFLTISLQAYKTARANPVLSLRYE